MRNGICLCHIADAEGGDRSGQGKKKRQYGAGAAAGKCVFERVHGSAHNVAFRIAFPVFYGKHAFAEFGGDAEGCRDPHPYKRAGTAQDHCSRYADDIACADGCSERGHQRGKRRDAVGVKVRFARVLRVPSQCIFDGARKHAPRKEAGAHGEQDAGADKQKQHAGSPDKFIDRMQSMGQGIHDGRAFFFRSFILIKKERKICNKNAP